MSNRFKKRRLMVGALVAAAVTALAACSSGGGSGSSASGSNGSTGTVTVHYATSDGSDPWNFGITSRAKSS